MMPLANLRRPAPRTALVLLAGCLAIVPAPSDAAAATEPPSLAECLVLPPVGRYGRRAVFQDALVARIVAGQWAAPKAGDVVTPPGGPARTWEQLRAGADGSFRHAALRGGHAYFAVPSDQEQTFLLEASGHNLVYVNGEPRTGDPYGHGYVRLPVRLRAGVNDFLFHVGRGSLRARLTGLERTPVACFNTADFTLPDLILGEKVDTWAAVVVVNATGQTLRGLSLCSAAGEDLRVEATVPPLPPLSVRKVGFRLTGPAADAEGDLALKLELSRGTGEARDVLDRAAVTLRRLRPDQTHKRTFVSEIDGSVQYFAVVPPRGGPADGGPGLVLTLHGAGVEALGHAQAYAAKPWCYLVAPTNRRPFGFDWEDWGRLDALEVLRRAEQQLNTAAERTYLTGHSMGGHGAWHLGVTYPGRFAAVGPSAGWVSMASYAGARRPENPTPAEELLLRSAAPSDTLVLAGNLAAAGVFILHGNRDDNVPVQQARLIRGRLGEFHPDFVYHEEPGQGHWWSLPSPPHVGGTACVDWPPMFDFFARRRLPRPEQVRQVDFSTASPGVSAWCHWACVEAQEHAFQVSSLHLRGDWDRRTFTGTTANVARLALDLGPLKPGEPVHLQLDGQAVGPVPWPADGSRIWLARAEGRWQSVAAPPASVKGPHRYGPFKEAFRNRFALVYGTRGTAEENAWGLAKARYDAETFWYRGNGSVDVLADREWDPGAEPDRNVVLYGNAQTNGAWQALLGDSPVSVAPGRVKVGGRELLGDALACLFVRPRPGSNHALVGAVGGTGPAGMRLTDRQPYFVSGVGYPDCLVLGSECLAQGLRGVRVVGFFGPAWDVREGEFVWQPETEPSSR